VWGVVAEADGRIVGCNFLTERNAVRGVGPIAVLPDVQGTKAGRRLMEAVVERGRDAAGTRLVQGRVQHGVDVALRVGRLRGAGAARAHDRQAVGHRPPRDVEVRAMTATDLDACAELCRLVHGFDRTGELTDALGFSGPVVALRGGRGGRLPVVAVVRALGIMASRRPTRHGAVLLGRGGTSPGARRGAGSRSASPALSLVPRARPPFGEADDLDDARSVPGAARRLRAVDRVIDAAAVLRAMLQR
jgi:GNAT superfamily N-acetyltransferase